MCVCVYVTLFCWRLFHLISPRSEVTFDSNFVMVTSIYGALMLLNFCGDGGWGLELNFLGFQIEENFWEAKFLVFV